MTALSVCSGIPLSNEEIHIYWDGVSGSKVNK